MKILNFLISILLTLFISQSVIKACPTCLGLLQLQQEQRDSELVGEMEVSHNDDLTEDDFDDEMDNGFNDYDLDIMEEMNHE